MELGIERKATFLLFGCCCFFLTSYFNPFFNSFKTGGLTHLYEIDRGGKGLIYEGFIQ